MTRTIMPTLQHEQIIRDVGRYINLRGRAFMASHTYLNVSGTVAAALWFQAGSAAPNLNFFVKAGGAASIQFYEAPGLSASGTALPLVNLNRELLHVTGLQAWHSPTILVSGTCLLEIIVPGGTGATTPGGLVQSEMEWLLAPRTAYLITAFNRTATAEDFSIEIGFNEEE